MEDLASALPPLERRLQASPPPASQQLLICRAAATALLSGLLLIAHGQMELTDTAMLAMLDSQNFLLGSWQRVTGLQASGGTSGAGSSGAAASDAARGLLDILDCFHWMAFMLGTVGDRVPTWSAPRASFVDVLVQWLPGAVGTLASLLEEQGACKRRPASACHL